MKGTRIGSKGGFKKVRTCRNCGVDIQLPKKRYCGAKCYKAYNKSSNQGFMCGCPPGSYCKHKHRIVPARSNQVYIIGFQLDDCYYIKIGVASDIGSRYKETDNGYVATDNPFVLTLYAHYDFDNEYYQP